jgi:hypothetical protein
MGCQVSCASTFGEVLPIFVGVACYAPSLFKSRSRLFNSFAFARCLCLASAFLRFLAVLALLLLLLEVFLCFTSDEDTGSYRLMNKKLKFKISRANADLTVYAA